MGMIAAVSPKGRLVRISDKLFVSVYRSQGYRLPGEPVVVPASEVPVSVTVDVTDVADGFDRIESDGEGISDGPLESPPITDRGLDAIDEDEPILAVPIDGSAPAGPVSDTIARLTRGELNDYAESLGIVNAAGVGNKATLLNLIRAHLREQG